MAYLVWFCSFRSKSSPSVFCRILHLCFVGLQFFRHCYLGSHFISRLVFAYVFTRKCRFCAHIYHQKTARSRKEKWPPTACNFAHTTPHRATEIHPRSSSLGKLSHTLFPISFASCHITSRCASSSLCYQSSSCAAFLSRGTSTSTGVRRMSRCSNTASSREENFSREPACVVTWRSLAPRGASNRGRGGRDHAPGRIWSDARRPWREGEQRTRDAENAGGENRIDVLVRDEEKNRWWIWKGGGGGGSDEADARNDLVVVSKNSLKRIN